MPADANIFQQYLQPIKSVADYSNEYDKAEGNKLALAASRLQAQQAQQSMADDQALRSAYSQSAGDSNKLMQLLRSGGQYKAVQGLEKTQLDNRKTQSEIDEKAFKVAKESHAVYQNTLGALAYDPALTRDKVIQAGQSLVQSGIMKPEVFQSAIASMPDEPVQLKQRLLQGVHAQLTPEQLMQAFAPKPVEQSNGQQKFFVDNNPNSPTYGQRTGAAPVQMQADPNAVLNSQTSRENNKATVGATIRGQNLTDLRARDANNLTKEANATVYDADRGVLVNKGTGLVRPAATIEGKPVGAKDKPLPEGAQKQIIGTRNLQDAIDSYQNVLAGFGTADMAKPDARAKMGNAYNNMMLQAKEAYNLGVLNGPDYDILQSVVKDPTKATSILTSNKAMSDQAASLKGIAANIERTVLEAHGKAYTPRPGASLNAPKPAGAKFLGFE